MDGKKGTFTLILNQISGTRKVVDKAPEGTSVDLVRLKTKFPGIASAITRTGVKLTLTAKTDDKGQAYVAQHPNEAVEYQCLMGAGEVKHSMKPKALMNKKGPATLMTLDLTRNGEDGKPNRCTNRVIVAKGDEHLKSPICDECRGSKETTGGNLPTDILGALGLDVEEV